jgi:hypothetical protein
MVVLTRVTRRNITEDAILQIKIIIRKEHIIPRASTVKCGYVEEVVRRA